MASDHLPKDALQAVVLCDFHDHHDNFRPLSHKQRQQQQKDSSSSSSSSSPNCLLPLANVALLDRTLEFLLANGAKEIFVVSGKESGESIEKHGKRRGGFLCCEQQNNNNNGGGGGGSGASWSGSSIRLLQSANLETIGDALRFVEQQQVINHDFILCTGDIVSNVDLSRAVTKHKQRRKKDKLCVATLCFAKDGRCTREGKFGEAELMLGLARTSIGGSGGGGNKEGNENGNSSNTNSSNDDEFKIVAFKESKGGVAKAMGGPFIIDAALFSEHEEVEVETNARDLRVDICSPEVLMLFTDNFDYQSLRKDFVCGVLDERELGNQLHAHFIDLGREYCARASDVRSFGAIGRDVVRGYCHPQTVDGNCVLFDNTNKREDAKFRKSNYRKIVAGKSGGISGFENSFADDDVAVDASASIQSGCVLGRNTKVGANCVLRDAILGQNCSIGSNVTIINCVLFDGCVVENDAKLSHALVGYGAKIGEKTIIHAGSVVGTEVIIGKNFELAPNSRIGCVPQSSCEDDDSDSDSDASSTMSGEDSNGSHLEGDDHHHHHDFEHLYGEEMAKKFAEQLHLEPDEECHNAQSVGVGGKGYRWVCPSFRSKSLAPGVIPKKKTYPNEMKSNKNKAEEMLEAKEEANASGDENEDVDDGVEEDSDSDSDADERHFHKEVSETFLRALRDDTIDENVTVELQGLKMAENRTFADIARYVLCAMFALSMPATAKCDKQFRKLFPAEFPSDANECILRVKKHVKRYAPLLAKFLKSEDDQVEVLLTLEEFCAEEGAFKDCQGKRVANAFAKLLHLLYDADVLSESAILAWADEKDGADEKDLVFLKKAAPFVKWLREAESETEDDESSDED